jgi:RNA polymerase sigma-B factor
VTGVPPADGAATDAVDDVGTVVEIRLPATLRAPFIARRVVGSLIVTGPRLRAIDASLLAGEITTVMLTGGTTLVLKIVESGRSIRVSMGSDDGGIGEPDEIVRALLDRISDRWSDEGPLWFELDLIRRQDLTGLSDDELFALLPDDREARDELFERYTPFASSVSRRFRARDRRADDLEQVAMLGLVRALERFDPALGVKFTTFAGQWIAGLLKRHLRDHSWSIRVPRSLKEGALAVTRARAELEQTLGREPTVEELAETLDTTTADLEEAILAGDTYTLTSLDAPTGSDESTRVGDLIGAVDSDLALVEDWPAIEAVLDRLTDREQQILYLRFFEDLTQSEIAPIVGVSQVHVSRILKQSLEKVRTLLEGHRDG